MSRVPKARLLHFLFGYGALGCLVSAVIIGVFVTNLAAANALQAAPVCSTATRSPSSNCLSLYTGQITWEGAVSKGDTRVDIALEDTTVNDLGYRCSKSPANACSFPIQAGTTVVTMWWKGKVVAFGAPGSRPSVVTDQSPIDSLGGWAYYMVAAIPGISAIVAGLLVWQAPAKPSEVVRTLLVQQPDPPRKVDVKLVWRATLGYATWGGYILWAVLYAATALVLMINSAAALAPVFFIGEFVIAMGLASLVASVSLGGTLQTAARRMIVVKKFQTLPQKLGSTTRVWYDRLDGSITTTDLGTSWQDHVKAGDRLEALTDPKTGEIERILSSSPAQA